MRATRRWPWEEKPALQVALDMTSLEDALRVARAAWANGAEVLEAGTPLIKAVGMEAVRALRRNFPEAVIVADTKIMDAGRIEAGVALDAGADIVTVLGVASDETIREVVEAAHEHGALAAVDMINHPDPVARAEQVAKLGADIVILHVAVDVQKARGVTAAEAAPLVPRVKSVFNGWVAVAGGLNRETAPIVAKAGANIVIVGSAITKASDPGRATKEIVEALRSL
ncbi:Orotidine 5'-phosphate decarboxylase [Pyrolobus fumarii 1A]|uniref:Orotidine 5'-phosphate decarboxylase n=1 Tax=Pyrolobus fumarii (strain DSM 11204 / 1A) TaxID=694429 RepID=G0EHE2_PYRF1|nr:orotidine 5'-phosphate decarboxylase / HUMPS family protein [Pyrolobus fumarii]AEM38517.1 Orotidine 5'-phosphate decarboxylase [Pyrolobus fumarii 1A]